MRVLACGELRSARSTLASAAAAANESEVTSIRRTRCARAWRSAALSAPARLLRLLSRATEVPAIGFARARAPLVLREVRSVAGAPVGLRSERSSCPDNSSSHATMRGSVLREPPGLGGATRTARPPPRCARWRGLACRRAASAARRRPASPLAKASRVAGSAGAPCRAVRSARRARLAGRRRVRGVCFDRRASRRRPSRLFFLTRGPRSRLFRGRRLALGA